MFVVCTDAKHKHSDNFQHNIFERWLFFKWSHWHYLVQITSNKYENCVWNKLLLLWRLLMPPLLLLLLAAWLTWLVRIYLNGFICVSRLMSFELGSLTHLCVRVCAGVFLLHGRAISHTILCQHLWPLFRLYTLHISTRTCNPPLNTRTHMMAMNQTCLPSATLLSLTCALCAADIIRHV